MKTPDIFPVDTSEIRNQLDDLLALALANEYDLPRIHKIYASRPLIPEGYTLAATYHAVMIDSLMSEIGCTPEDISDEIKDQNKAVRRKQMEKLIAWQRTQFCQSETPF